MIWFDPQLSLTALTARKTQTLADWLGIEFTELGADHLTARMPVNERTRQPMGVLHGGASCVLAETLGSVASALVIDCSRFYAVGLEINANHIKMAKEGYVEGTVKPLHLGRSTHVWEIRIMDESLKLVCISRLTVAILQKQEP